nr:integrase, catalytic region, zinc finger, CCHC-type, peptidase aspartic, catalytic [Tanacetum cinerariifolium]
MLDRTDFASWQQRIRLYCRGKENGVNILKSIDEWPYKIRTFKETLADSTEGTPKFGPERPRVYSDLTSEEKDRGEKIEVRDESTGWRCSWIWGVQNRVGNVNPGQERPVKCYNCNGADVCDAFDSDVDEAPTAQTMFMANLSSADPVTDEAGPSYDSDILSEVRDHDHYQDAVCARHEEHAMHDSDNEVPVVHSDVSSVPNDAFMMIYNYMCKPHAQSVSNPSRLTVVENSLTDKLATYKEQVELYERRAKFELTEREQKINEQLRLVISDHNFKEETLETELHSIRLQLASTINHNKSMVEEVTFLKKDLKKTSILKTFWT